MADTPSPLSSTSTPSSPKQTTPESHNQDDDGEEMNKVKEKTDLEKGQEAPKTSALVAELNTKQFILSVCNTAGGAVCYACYKTCESGVTKVVFKALDTTFGDLMGIGLTAAVSIEMLKRSPTNRIASAITVAVSFFHFYETANMLTGPMKASIKEGGGGVIAMLVIKITGAALPFLVAASIFIVKWLVKCYKNSRFYSN